jgi:hypothetical protein
MLGILQSIYNYHTTIYIHALQQFSLQLAMEKPASWKYLLATKSAWLGSRIVDYNAILHSIVKPSNNLLLHHHHPYENAFSVITIVLVSLSSTSIRYDLANRRNALQ